MTHPTELEPHHIMHRVGTERALPMDRVHTFLKKNALIDDPDDTIYAHWWKAASPDSFRPAIDLVEARAAKSR